jgi:hypothetical protein
MIVVLNYESVLRIPNTACFHRLFVSSLLSFELELINVFMVVCLRVKAPLENLIVAWARCFGIGFVPSRSSSARCTLKSAPLVVRMTVEKSSDHDARAVQMQSRPIKTAKAVTKIAIP